MSSEQPTLKRQAIAQAFSAAAPTYDRAAFPEQEIGARLLERLAAIKLKPTRILDVCCGTGYHTKQLQLMFPQASIIGLDLAFGMTKFANNKTNNSAITYICGDAEKLPFANQSFDLVFSNCGFMLINNLRNLSSELQRILCVNGNLLFTTLGPDTLKELAIEESWLDMHHIGDALLQAQFKDPVVDVEMLNFTYPSLKVLLQDLTETGAYEITDLTAIPNLNDPCAVTFEVIYGYAQTTQLTTKQFSDENGRVFVPIDSIKCL